MSVLTAQQDIARPVSSNWPEPTDNPVLDAVLSGLERFAARLPYALALPVMLAYEGLCRTTAR